MGHDEFQDEWANHNIGGGIYNFSDVRVDF
jgi:hypothetical protein